MLEGGPWHGRAEHVANGLLLVALLAGVIASAARVWRTSSATLAADVYLVALLPVTIYLLLGKDTASPKTDLPVGFMTFVVGYLDRQIHRPVA